MYKSQTSAKLIDLNNLEARKVKHSKALASEKLSPAFSVALGRRLHGQAKSGAGGRGARHLRNVRRRYRALLAPYNAAEAARIAAAQSLINADNDALIIARRELARSKERDYTESQLVILREKAAAARLIGRQRSERLSTRIATNTTGLSINGERLSNASARISANVSAKPTNAQKAAAQVEARLASKANKTAIKSMNLAVVDAQETAKAALLLDKIFKEPAKPKSPLMPVLAGAAMGLKVGGIQGAAIGAVAGFVMGKGQ